jgi:hypothetical protein
MRGAWAGLACVFLMSTFGQAADTSDLQNIDRQIEKEPAYIAKRPLFGLLVFGPEAQKRIWMVFDRSKPRDEFYDVLYVDLNANGDLTEPTERLVGRVQAGSVRFQLPDLRDPATGAVHTGFTARVSVAPAPTIMVSLSWRDRFKMGGGNPQESEDGYLQFGDKPANAPVMWVNGDGPFRFQRWYGGRLSMGGADDFKVFVGQRGAGTNAFWAFQEHFLPQSEAVKATLIYRDGMDKEHRVTCLLKERC